MSDLPKIGDKYEIKGVHSGSDWVAEVVKVWSEFDDVTGTDVVWVRIRDVNGDFPFTTTHQTLKRWKKI